MAIVDSDGRWKHRRWNMDRSVSESISHLLTFYPSLRPPLPPGQRYILIVVKWELALLSRQTWEVAEVRSRYAKRKWVTRLLSTEMEFPACCSTAPAPRRFATRSGEAIDLPATGEKWAPAPVRYPRRLIRNCAALSSTQSRLYNRLVPRLIWWIHRCLVSLNYFL